MHNAGRNANNAKKASVSASAEGYKAFQLFTRMEQAPNPASRVMLDTEKDSLGMPRAMLHWELTALEKRSLRKIYETIGREFGRAGLGRVQLMDYIQDEKDESWPSFTGGGWHHMGTTRMSDDPKNGVVDANCKVHGIANLYMAGSSCYVTAAAPNPTLTLVALTLRLSDHLKIKLA
jgi:choline dehydrogenase-like flavoprotein